jgi:hypothetical protein
MFGKATSFILYKLIDIHGEVDNEFGFFSCEYRVRHKHLEKLPHFDSLDIIC